MNRHAWWVVFIKEARENLRDRRTLMSALLFGPLMFPAILVLMLTVVSGQKKDDIEKPLKLPVIGAPLAPNLVDYLKRNAVTIDAAPEDPKQAVTDRKAQVVLEIPPSYPEDFRAGKPATLIVHYDRTDTRASTAVNRLEALLQGYGSSIASLRLAVRGIDSAVVRPVLVEERDASGVNPLIAFLVGFLPYGLMFAAFMGGMYLAIDSTSGERERLTLEPLLVNPVPRSQLVLGKLVATVVFSAVSLALCVSAMSYGLSRVPSLPGGLELTLDPASAAKIFLIALPIVLFASASQMLIASYTRSYREAQTYVQLFQVVPMIPSMVQVMSPVTASAASLAVPALGQSILIGLIGRGQEVTIGQALWSASVTIAVGAVIAMAVVWRYRQEKLVG